MRTLEERFIKEFKQAVRVIGSKDIYSIPLPEVVGSWGISGTELYRVMGVETEYFSNLNDAMVKRVPKGYEVKRRVIDKAKRSYKVNEEGKFVYEKYAIPGGSTVVTCSRDISLPYKLYTNPPKGYGYVDFIRNSDGSKRFIYVIPNDCLYKVNQTALAISVKNMKNYQGMGYLTWNNGVIFIHVIPYNPNSQYVGSKILKTGVKLDYMKEIHILSDYWESVGLIPNIQMCALQNGENLVLKPTVTGYDEYTPVELNPIGYKDTFGEENGQ